MRRHSVAARPCAEIRYQIDVRKIQRYSSCMQSKAQLAKRARIYDAQERASDHGPGHPPGPMCMRIQRAPPAVGNVKRLRRLRKQAPAFHALALAGELTISGAFDMAFNRPGQKPKGRIPAKIMSLRERWEAGLLGANEARQLETKWREEFFRSLAPGFTFDDGVRGTLSGRAAHIAHLVDHDIPASLCEYWAASNDAA
jgi:hypothetical protein